MPFKRLRKSIINTSIQAALTDNLHPAFGKSNSGLKRFLKRHQRKKPLQATSFRVILYTETFTELSLDFRTLRGQSISGKSDADPHFKIMNNHTFKMQQTFPNKHKSLRICSAEVLYVGCRLLSRDCC